MAILGQIMPSNLMTDDLSTIVLHDHFMALMSMGGVFAMQFICDAVQETSTRDHNNDTMYVGNSLVSQTGEM